MLILPIAMLLLQTAAAAPDVAINPVSPLEILKYEVLANQDTPELCFLLSQTVARRPTATLESFVGTDPITELTAIPRNDRLCLSGLAFGNAYSVTIKAGLPGVSGTLPKDMQFRVQVPNRAPEVSFAATEGNVLPRIASEGLPIRSVNAPKIDVNIFRIADNNLLFDPERLPLTADDIARFVPNRGTRVWRGTIEAKGDPNRDSVTMLPLDATVGALIPGLYVATAWPTGIPSSRRNLPTQYFTVSDIGLSAYCGLTSLLVAARSLSTAAVAPGIDVALVARNNRELGRVRTDGNGLARFDPGLLQNSDGNSAETIRAYGQSGEFAALNLAGAACLEATKSGVGSRVASLYLDRASYLPGETVNILALLRSGQGASAPKLPLGLSIIRPNGTVFAAPTLSDQGDRSYNFDLTVPSIGSEGTWRVVARSDTADAPVGEAQFEVGTPPSSRLNVVLNADVSVIDPAQPANIAVQTQSPDGVAPNTPGELQVAIAAAASPFPAFPGFSFGAVDEHIPPVALDPLRFATDGAGKANMPVKITIPAKATKPLDAIITARMFDSAGRIVERTVTVPVANQALLLGVKPSPMATFPVGQNAHFEIIAVSPDGARQEKPGVGWEILRQDWKPSWYWDGNGFSYRPAVKDSHIAGGTVDIPANAPGILDTALPPGRYRIEIFDPNGEAISSARFMVGWAVRGTDDPPDTVELTPVKPFYAPGEGADIFVKPPYDADVTLVPADPQILEAVIQHVPAAGGVMHLNMRRDAGEVTRLLATALAPPDSDTPGMTRRAFGQTEFTTDPAIRSLDVKMDLPSIVTPQRTLAVPVTVSGAGDEPVHVHIAVLDDRLEGEGAEHEAGQDSLSPSFAAEATAVDTYGRVITASGLSSGGIETDTAQTGKAQRPPDSPKPTQRPLALYSGVVTLDKGGKGSVLLVLPDYAGQVKIKTLAWSTTKTGHSEAELAVRYPLNASLPLPAYLSPDDHAELTLELDNIDGPRGEYHVQIHAEGQVSVQDEAETIVNLAEHEQRTLPVTLQAHAPGEGAIIISFKGPDGIAFERRLRLEIRANIPAVTRRTVVTLKPGTTLVIDPVLTSGLRPEALSVSYDVSTGNDFDLASIAQELSSSGTGSALQLVNSVTPFFAPSAVLQTLHMNDVGSTPAQSLEIAAQALAGYQNDDGGMSLWGGAPSDIWLTAQIADFMGRAKAVGVSVSDPVFSQVLDYLALHSEPQGGEGAADPSVSVANLSQQALAAAAYANKTLAANGRLNLFQLRYFNDRFGPQIRNPAAAGLLAASFAALGDKSTSAASFARAATLPADPSIADSYGSDLRDQALLTALMAESGAVAQPLIAAAIAKTTANAATHRQFSTQEASWIFRAASIQTPNEASFTIKVGDKKIEQNTPYGFTNTGPTQPPIKNAGDTAIHIAITASGPPALGEFRDQTGYEVQRWFFDTSGKPIDPAVLKQGDLVVVVLTGRYTGQGDARPLLIDAICAGWAVEAAEIRDPANRYPWLKDLSGADHAAVNDGRYVATPRLTGEHHEFKLAYVIRAAVRGQFNLPGTVVEDMVQPAMSARGIGQRIKIDPAS